MKSIEEKLKQIVDNGFKLTNDSYELENLAFVSLRLALKSYFSTYKSNEIYIADFIENGENLEEKTNKLHAKDYYENYFECIVHFQHFFELIMKDILEKISKLLVVRVHDRHDILYKLINNETLENDEENKLFSIEFSEVLKAFPQLKKKGVINDRYNFLADSDNIKILGKLNKLRNKIWHRGLYILQYNDLDMFIGKFVLPLVQKIVDDIEYQKFKKIWKYQYIANGIEPLNEIIDLYDCSSDFTNNKHIRKVAYLKEMGRAAYYNSIKKSEWESKDYDRGKNLHIGWAYFDKKKFDIKNRIALQVANIKKEEEGYHYNYTQEYICPVCGLETLIEYRDYLTASDMDNECDYYEWTEKVECCCCGFAINQRLGNAEELGLKIDNYFNE